MRFRGQFCYVNAVLPGQRQPTPILRLRYQGSINGEVIGRIGHTGNSTNPHLHFQLMDSIDLMTAKGIPCAFRSYEVQRDGAWEPVQHGVPRRSDRCRR